jgi:hypothetical protein
MFNFFNEPYEGELLYSVAARYHFYSANTSDADTAFQLFGSRSAYPVIELPNGIEHLVKSLNSRKITEDLIIRNHTLYPVFEPFLHEERKARALELMKGTGHKGVHSTVGLNSGSEIKGNQELFYCPLCAKADMERVGEPYFHRGHQFHKALVCPKHGCRLKSYHESKNNTKKLHYIRLDERFIDWEPDYIEDVKVSYMLLELSKASEYLLRSNLSRFNFHSVQERYHSLLKNKGFTMINGRIKRDELFKAFKKFYGDELLDMLQSNFHEHDKTTWLTTITKSKNVLVHPLRHLLFIIFLYDSVDRFFEDEIKHIGPFGEGPWPCLNKLCPDYKKFVIKEYEVKNRCDTGKPLGTFRCSCGFTYARSGPDVNEEDKYRIGKIKDYGHLWKSKLETLIKEQKYSIYKLAEMMMCFRQTIANQARKMGMMDMLPGNAETYANKRVIFEQDEFMEKSKKDILDFLKANPKATRERVRDVLLRQYLFLCKYDKEWLYKTVKEKEKKAQRRWIHKPFDWNAKDEEYVSKLREIHKEILEEEKPIRITHAILLRRMGKTGIAKSYSKLPKTHGYLNEVAETIEQFNLRKLDRACEYLYRTEGKLIKWHVLKEADVETYYKEEYILNRIEELALMYGCLE